MWEYNTDTGSQENALAFFDSQGSYRIRLEVSNGYTPDVVEESIYINGIKNALTNKFINVFPNPVDDQLDVMIESEHA